ATAALEEVFARTMPREMGFDYTGISYQEQKAQQGVPASVGFGFSLLFVFCASRTFVRKLVAAVQRVAEPAGSGIRRLRCFVVAPRCAWRVFTGLHGPNRKRCVFANRSGHADWVSGQERNSDRGIR